MEKVFVAFDNDGNIKIGGHATILSKATFIEI